MEFRFSEPAWDKHDVLEFWQRVHGELNENLRTRFLSNTYVLLICDYHPAHIREAIHEKKKISEAYSYIFYIESRNNSRVEELLGENHPSHAEGITNAHHGNRTTDPFDPLRDDLLFKCIRCNLKLSLTRKSKKVNAEPICLDCDE